MKKAPTFNRRKFLTGLGTLSVAALGSGIWPLHGQAIQKRASSQKVLHEGYPVQLEEKGGVINYLTWYGYDSEQVLEPFIKRYNCEVNCEFILSDPKALQRLRIGGTRQFHLITLNNCWAKEMYKDGLITPLAKQNYRHHFDNMIERFTWPYKWAMSSSNDLLGIPQRYGPFNLVINTKVISPKTAQNEGWNLFIDPANKNRWALLSWENWVLYHICQSAGIYPFKSHTSREMKLVEKAAYNWFDNARYYTQDEMKINKSLVNKEIGWYCCGGIYTASPPRRNGRWEIEAVTPRHGSMENGAGGIAWTELTSMVHNPSPSPLADDFITYMQEPDASYHIAMAKSTHNPVANMASSKVMRKFSRDDLKAIQYDQLERDLQYCEDYNYNPDFNAMMRFYRRARASKARQSI